MIHALAGLVFLGAAIKLSRGSESFGLGTIPPPPDSQDFCEWARTTFGRVWDDDGIRNAQVRTRVDIPLDDGSILPSGSRAEVFGVDCMGFGSKRVQLLIKADVVEYLFTSHKTVKKIATLDIWPDAIPLDILDDNWGPLVIQSKKSYKAGWTPKPTRYKGRP